LQKRLHRVSKIDPAAGNVTEYKPKNPSQLLDEPSAVLLIEWRYYPYGRTRIHRITAFKTLLASLYNYPSIE
jgi:hypothetical protein